MGGSRRPNRWKIGLGVSAMIAAGIVWTVRLVDDRSFDAETFRNTQGVESEVLTFDSSDRGYRVRFRVANRGQDLAEQVVVTASILGPDGQIVTQNPLISLSDLSPGDTREMDVHLPHKATGIDCSAEVEVSLVRWASN